MGVALLLCLANSRTIRFCFVVNIRTTNFFGRYQHGKIQGGENEVRSEQKQEQGKRQAKVVWPTPWQGARRFRGDVRQLAHDLPHPKAPVRHDPG
jgi:hypothetical protein